MSDSVDWTTLPVPFVDYSTETAIASLPFTATKDQMILMAINGTQDLGCVIQVNGARAAQNNNTKAVTCMFPVRAGDTITQVQNNAPAPAYIYAYDIRWRS